MIKRKDEDRKKILVPFFRFFCSCFVPILIFLLNFLEALELRIGNCLNVPPFKTGLFLLCSYFAVHFIDLLPNLCPQSVPPPATPTDIINLPMLLILFPFSFSCYWMAGQVASTLHSDCKLDHPIQRYCQVSIQSRR